ncbi:type II toxin-antitoxin system RelE/ParE family toxin [Skermanella pratensis]|uniref:type II toxin-antitoxin system RelE/ParE family toxin n=1 Tax=Skermanella pratensis TaxID=2233999 RepID=UPI0013013BFF|nr:type II toxin-antitoxin system RelE/ParE family toxin [Skermanella pratensis]
MIKTFADKGTAALFQGHFLKGMPADIQRRALVKLVLIDTAVTVEDLRVPPGNRLEALRGDRQGQYSIRVNGQWRICFVWKDGDAFEVEIVDYH